MKYEADIGLFNLIDQVRKKLTRDFYFAIVLCIFFFLIMPSINRGASFWDYRLWICIAIFLFVMGYMQYGTTMPKAIIINQTATEVVIENEEIIIKTAPFKLLFWIDKKPGELRFRFDEVKMRKISYQIKMISDIDQKVVKLTDKEKEAFIVYDFFGEELIDKLREIKGPVLY